MPETKASATPPAMKITTGRIGRTSRPDEIVIDVTVKSGLKAFAPSWDMVMSYKNGTLSEKGYTERYYEMMRASWKNQRAAWQKLLDLGKSGKTIVLVCYCPRGDFCHRHLLASMLKACARKQGITSEVLPEA